MNKKHLISTVSAMVLLLANPVLAAETTPDLSNKPITKPTLDYLGKTSAYEIMQGTESDYSFINLVTDSEGNISKEYYKINLTGPKNVTWSDTGDHEISLNLPNSETPTTFKYSINPDAALGTRTDNRLTQEKVDGKLFANIQSDGTLVDYAFYEGGAIYNSLNNEIVNINSDFIGNSITKSSKGVRGGVIANNGTDAKLGNITGNFIGNYALNNDDKSAFGGAIYNREGTIGDITGDFIGNYAKVKHESAYGGAIYSYKGAIGNITGDFIGNYVIAGYSAQGGAIYNSSTIASITGDFIGNYVMGESSVGGGAIYNYGTITSITGDFIENHGGAINNKGTITSLTGNFIKNYDTAIDNDGTIVNITSDFIGNYGRAIYNRGNLGLTNSNFINNYTQSSSSSQGGAIYNSRTMTLTDSNFIGNYVIGDVITGGAIYNNGTITSIIGNFVDNSAQGSSSAAGGAIAIYGSGKIGDITGDFTENYAISETSDAKGGAIYNSNGTSSATIGNITGNFIENYTQSKSSYAQGGAIYNYASQNSSKIEDIIGSAISGKQIAFQNNYVKTLGADSSAQAYGGAIYNYAENQKTIAKIGNIYGDFIGNYAQSMSSSAYGGAIYNYAKSATAQIGKITGGFINNYAKGSSSVYGGAIYNNYGTIGDITGDFIGNYAESESSNAQGGAIYNNYKIGNIINSNFLNNHVSGSENSNGGAIYSTFDFNILADNSTSEFTGNYVDLNSKQIPNAIYMSSAIKTLTLNALNNGQILFNDEIDGAEGYKIALTGDETGTIDFNNNIRNANISLVKTTANISKGAYLNNNNALSIKSGVMNIVDLGDENVHFITFNVGNNAILNIGSTTADLENQTMGRISADASQTGTGVINVNNILLMTDGQEGDTPVLFADKGFKGQVQTTVTESLAPIYKYSVAYNAETGEFVFTRGDNIGDNTGGDNTGGDNTGGDNTGGDNTGGDNTGGDNTGGDNTGGDTGGDNNDDNKPSVPTTPVRPIKPTYKAFNPGVFANDIFAKSALNVQNNVMKEVTSASAPESFDYSKGRVWAVPYYSDDTLSFNDFYDVDSTNYGLIAGVDSKAYGNVNGWNSVYTVFGAYNDGENKYQGVKVDTKSWLVGLKASVYNGGFYGDVLVNYAWHDGKSKSAFGTDNIDATGYGVSLKAGYKYDVECNRWITDTGLLMNWQRVSVDDYTAKSGVKFENDDYSRLTLTPQVKVGYRALKYWTPYALARYNFVLSEDGSTKLNNSFALPEIESKDYVEYGLGIETANTDNHSGYAHVLRHDGGREGWSVTAGYRYNF